MEAVEPKSCLYSVSQVLWYQDSRQYLLCALGWTRVVGHGHGGLAGDSRGDDVFWRRVSVLLGSHSDDGFARDSCGDEIF